jgi:hypothetical protein
MAMGRMMTNAAMGYAQVIHKNQSRDRRSV